MNNELFNPYEGQEVEKLVWPFYRYSALIPEQIGGDLFVWLYLSLISFENQNQGFPRDNYSNSVKQNVEKIISDKFSAVIDSQTLEKIVYNAEYQFIENSKIKESTFSFIDTYESLFSDKLDVKYIYQDAITGDVLPFFGDTSDIVDAVNLDKKISVRTGIKEPSKKAVKKAYQQYMRIKRYNNSEEEQFVDPEDEFFDEDEQTFLDDAVDEVSFIEEEEEKKEKKSLNNYNVIFLKDKQVLFNLEVPLIIEDNEIVPKSPFGQNTNQWIKMCMKKGRNVSEDLDEQFKELEAQFVIEEKRIDTYVEAHKKDFASSLHVCQTLYRTIDSLNDNKIREYVVKLDATYYEQSEMFYSYCGKYLERLLKKISYTKTDATIRTATNYEMFCRELDIKCQHTNISYNRLKKIHLHKNWQNKYGAKGKDEFGSFKADIADIMLQTDLINSCSMYPSFIDDTFNLYDKRSEVVHDNDKESVKIDQKNIDKILKITRVFFELI